MVDWDGMGWQVPLFGPGCEVHSKPIEEHFGSLVVGVGGLQV